MWYREELESHPNYVEYDSAEDFDVTTTFFCQFGKVRSSEKFCTASTICIAYLITDVAIVLAFYIRI